MRVSKTAQALSLLVEATSNYEQLLGEAKAKGATGDKADWYQQRSHLRGLERGHGIEPSPEQKKRYRFASHEFSHERGGYELSPGHRREWRRRRETDTPRKKGEPRSPRLPPGTRDQEARRIAGVHDSDLMMGTGGRAMSRMASGKTPGVDDDPKYMAARNWKSAARMMRDRGESPLQHSSSPKKFRLSAPARRSR